MLNENFKDLDSSNSQGRLFNVEYSIFNQACINYIGHIAIYCNLVNKFPLDFYTSMEIFTKDDGSSWVSMVKKNMNITKMEE